MRGYSFLVTLAAAALVVAACGDNRKVVGAAPAPDAGVGSDAGSGTETDPAPAAVTCPTALPASTNTCDVTPGSSTMLIEGTVLTPTTVYTNGQVAVDDTGKISCVGCDCAKGGETTIVCSDAAISPGLINTHDHITYTHNNPYVATTERYEDRQQWREGQDGHYEIPYLSQASNDQISWGELRFLMGGATSIVGSGGQPGLLRNLDQASNEEGLGKPAVDFDTFPLDDSGGTRRTADCNYGTSASPTTAASIAQVDAYEPHTSEGIDATARNEFLCETSASYDTMPPGLSNNLLVAKTAMIHAIGLRAEDYGAMATAGTSLIWSPRSNISLYGDTARVTTAHRLGVRIALGTDWMPSGSMNLLRELSCADSFNATYLDHYFRDDQLWKMVTVNAAGLTATEDVIGSLAPGKIADISIFASHGKPPFRSVIEAEPKDVALVMRGGKVLYGDDAAIAALTAVAARTDSCDTVDVCGTAKRVCVMGEVKKTYDALKTAANIYPAFACGVPDNEPVCAPSRPVSVASSTVYTGMTSDTDSDGDGIPDAMDNCPKVFNPIRPLDEGKQGDADGDGVGDACDPCPLDANSTACTPIATGDRDHDGVPDISDNCPEIANPDQADDDKDGKGNACDACPADANPGSAGCPASIYQIKKGQVPVGSAVRVTNALVTGLGTNGFFVQVKETDTGVYDGSDYSGMFVFTSVNPHSDPKYVGVIPGARVNIDGAVDNFHGELELDNLVQVQVVSTGLEDPPAPVAAAYADVNTGGARLASLEGVIVSLGAAVPTAINATSGEIALTYAAGQAISLDHFVFAVPAPVIGQSYTAVTGILALRQPVPAAPASIAKIEPRSAADLPLGPPVIALFGPALSSARVGTTINLPTFPDPLTVTLSSPATEATTIALTSSDTNALAVSDLVIPKDGTTGTVLVTALAPSADVTITGTLNGQTVTAHVQVLSEIAVPSKVTLSPATSSIAPNGSVQLTATLDLPATESTPITLDVAPLLAGTLPATVNIDAGQTTVTFTYTDSSAASAQITATFLASTSTATVNVTSGPNHLVISQVYGGGQGTATTTPFASDFVELHNPTSTPLSLAGLSIQYASATNANGAWSGLTILPALTVLPGGYVLVGEATGTVGAQVPTPDVIGTIAVSATAAKVALVSGITTLANGCPATGIIDHVAYGVSTVTCFEGSGPVPASPTPMSAATSAKRLLDGCRDTDDNATDFAVAAATAPRNSASAPVPCQ